MGGNSGADDPPRALSWGVHQLCCGVNSMTQLTNTPKCPLCDGPTTQYYPHAVTTEVECVRCGCFNITLQAIAAVSARHLGYKPLLSAYCRRRPQGAETPTIKTDTIEQFIQTLPHYTPPEKLDNLLELMARMTPRLGEPTGFNADTDYPLLIAQGPNEVRFLALDLDVRGYLYGPRVGPNSPPTVLLRGWERLEEIKRSGRLSNRAFVAMWFDKGTDDLYDQAVKPAIEKAGYDPLRVDKHEHVNRIDDEIIGQIKRSRFMVADFTGQRYGVYFEAGMMIGLGRTVIWMCDKKQLNDLHFDVRQFNFIDYESLAEAQDRLYNRILAIEGEGPGQFEKP
jgi:hypothetical protein